MPPLIFMCFLEISWNLHLYGISIVIFDDWRVRQSDEGLSRSGSLATKCRFLKQGIFVSWPAAWKKRMEGGA